MNEPQVLTPKRTEEGKRMRKDYEAHKVSAQRKEMQQLEPRADGVSNTLTTAQKDNYLMVPANTAEGYTQCEIGGVLDISYPNSTTRRGRVQEGGAIAPTLTCGCENTHARIEEMRLKREDMEEWKTIVGNKQMNPFRGSVENESPCITSACGCGGGMKPMVTNADLETTKTKEFIEQMRGHKEMQYRIRKLTPTECFRLMGVRDEDSGKIQEVVSKSQCYKLAGNSIVVDCMVHMFEQLFFDNKNKNQQLEIF